MKTRIAGLAISTLMTLAACDEPIAPRAPRVPQPGRPAFDHASNTYAMAYTQCEGLGSYCGVVVSHADGTVSQYHGGASGYGGANWAPDASKLAVSDWQDILVISLSGGQTVNLTNGIGSNYGPAWSPDGARIAFGSNRDGQPSLYVMRASDGGDVIRLTSGTEMSGKPTWSPDSRRLAFTCGVMGTSADVCVVNADGSGFARLTTTGTDGGADWSPDGTRIAFVTYRFSVDGYGDIATMAPDGSNVTRISRQSVQYPGGLDWSPGGTSIAYSRPYCSVFPDDCLGENGGGSEGDVLFYGVRFVMNADGTGVGAIGLGQEPKWQPGRPDPPPTTDQPPVARFTYSCPSLTCSFDGSTSSDDHGISRYSWTFGDGAAVDGAARSSVHAYATPGTYRVALTVTDLDGHTASVTQDVTTGPDQAPVAGFSWSCGSARRCYFNGGSSSDDNGVVSLAWTFGDGSSGSGSFLDHVYAANGTYDVTLTVQDNGGQTNSVTHRVTVVDGPPIASFSSSCGVKRACTFNSSASSDDYGIVARTWTFGDGSSVSNLFAPAHSYAVNGDYDVTLIVRDAAGQTNSLTQRVTVVDAVPVARFTYSCTNTTCTLDGRTSTDDFGVTSHRWDLGSYGILGGSLVTIRLKGRSSFSATLVVSDEAGQTNSTTQEVSPR